ncbi:hypothetical protein V1Y59_03830 [Gordonia sp. PKS22-38]|uniref:Glycosyltransferase RgtA/B/C/D-like domain-containing protein n=1 Tax=Gordonia prachuapensis TaxID=3115651 RepID=A0ABU7MPD6_9ACTN|nr:hypothetical protein [Gordonia sp. PKS22-38]
MTAPRQLLPLLFAVGAGLAALIMAPLLRPGHLLYRDAVSTPRSHVTDTTLGIGDGAPRAVPQDWAVALLSGVIDGGAVVVAITFAALMFAGVGYGLLAIRLVGAAGRTGAVVAAVVAIWNPFVAERLLQGHWSLLVSYAALSWVAVAAVAILGGDGRSAGLVGVSRADRAPAREAARADGRWTRENGRWVPCAQLVAALGFAGFTPTGSVLSALLMVALPGVGLILARRWLAVVLVWAAWVVAALPWLVATAVGSAAVTSGSGGFTVFGVRAEPGLGTVGTVLGLGGIWNADAVPASRTIWWAAVATALLLVVVVTGAVWLWRHRERDTCAVTALAALAAVTAVAVSVAAIGPVAEMLSDAATLLPGLGLFRDTQKFLALMVPFVAVASAAAVAAARRWVPSGFALAAAILLIVAPLPDLAWGVGGKIAPITYPPDWAAVAARISDDHGAVAIWPTGTVRQYTFADVPSLDPLPRMVRAPVTGSGSLVVDSVVVDEPSGRGAAVDAVLADGGSARALADLGVGWVVVENGTPPAALAREAVVVFDGADLRLYRVPGPIADIDASTPARVAVIGAHVIWATTTSIAVAAALVGARRRTRR